MYLNIDEIDLQELKFLAATENVSILPVFNDAAVEWSATYEEEDGARIGIRITGYGATIQHALRALYWKLISVDKDDKDDKDDK